MVYIYNSLTLNKVTPLGNTLGDITYPFVIAGICFIFGFYLANNFTMAFDTIIECMLFNLMAEEEMFMGRERFCEEDI